MNSTQGTISKVLSFSCVDGPGNRLVLFLQGCNFNCQACHNPHTIGQCNNCGDCVPVCHVDALSLVDGKIEFDPTDCDQCDACLDICPINANPMVSSYTVADVLAMLHKHKPFLNGLTVSGGEPTQQLGFIVDLFAAVKADPELQDLTCFIDTNGHLGASGWERLLPVTDGVMLDVKAFDTELHNAMTGKNNNRSLRSAQLVHEAGKLYEIRFLLIPGMTDTDAELERLAEFIAELGGDVQLRLNAFQHHGVRAVAQQWPKMPEEGVNSAASRLRAAGLDKIVMPAVYV